MGISAAFAADTPMEVEVKAESCKQREGHSRILRVSDCSDSASLTRSVFESVTQDRVMERRKSGRCGGGVLQMRKL